VEDLRFTRLRQWAWYGAGGQRARNRQPHLTDLQDCNIVSIGPLVLDNNGIVGALHYCAIGSNDGSGFFTIVCGSEVLDDAMIMRKLVHKRLLDQNRIAIDCKIELQMARHCEPMWPT
jgi:hypothetical protein